jgi:chromate transport protein ChrA
MAFNIGSYLLIMFLAGLGSFGGGLGAVNIIRDFAVNWNWILDEFEFLRIASISQFNGYSQGMMLAGYLAERGAIYSDTGEEITGFGLGLGIFGTLLGIIAFILPSIIIIIIILKIGEKLYKNSVFKYSLKYINLLAAGLICVILWNYAVVVFGIDPIIYVAVAGLACYVNIYFGINPAIIVLGGAVIGLIWRA